MNFTKKIVFVFFSVISLNAISDNPYSQWHLKSLEKVWATYTKGSENIIVAIVDSGVDFKHPDLSSNILINKKELNGRPNFDDDANGCVDDIYGCNIMLNNGDVMDKFGHGTHVAGVLGAVHNDIGTSGLMQKVAILPVKVLEKDKGIVNETIAAKGIHYALDRGAKIINLSFARDKFTPEIKKALIRAKDMNVSVVVSAGNVSTIFDIPNNDVGPKYPANLSVELDNVISVGFHNEKGQLDFQSNFGREKVQLCAPGRNIVSTLPSGNWGTMSGTSQAAPYVAGLIGLYLSYYGETSPKEIRKRLMETSKFSSNVRTKIVSAGLVDPWSFMEDIKQVDPILAGKWKTYKLPKKISTPNPYKANYRLMVPIIVPNAKYVRLKFAWYQLGKGDRIKVVGMNLKEDLGEITGEGIQKTSEYATGNNIILDFYADKFDHGKGFEIVEVEYQD